MKDKPKTESKEFQRFEELTKKLVSVPKKDVEKEEKKFRSVKKRSAKSQKD